MLFLLADHIKCNNERTQDLLNQSDYIFKRYLFDYIGQQSINEYGPILIDCKNLILNDKYLVFEITDDRNFIIVESSCSFEELAEFLSDDLWIIDKKAKEFFFRFYDPIVLKNELIDPEVIDKEEWSKHIASITLCIDEKFFIYNFTNILQPLCEVLKEDFLQEVIGKYLKVYTKEEFVVFEQRKAELVDEKIDLGEVSGELAVNEVPKTKQQEEIMDGKKKPRQYIYFDEP